MENSTLRQLNGFDEKPAALSHSTLLMVDFQNTYTRGVMALDGWSQAIDAAADLLSRARKAGAVVIHVINDGGRDTPYDIHAEVGQIHLKVAPAEGEEVVVKSVPNALVGTQLDGLLKAAKHDDVIVVGFMTHMCVLFTVQGVFLMGKRPTVVANACATRSLPPFTRSERSHAANVSSEHLHLGALATITDLFGVVVASADDLA